MTRIMFWNVEKFGYNKVTNPLGLRQTGGGLSQAAAAADRMTLMIRMVQQANPHILVIIEVATGAGGAGTVVSAKGVMGAETLLLNMQWAHAADWRLVPPLRTSNREGVAVFYRSTNLVFSGPYQWSGGAGGAAATGIAGAAYGWPENMLIGGNVVPGAARYNPGVAENVCAAQTTGWTAPPVGMAPPAPMPAFVPREPYFTTFAEVTGVGGMFLRDIAIFSIHAPANAAAAGPYMAALAATNEIVNPSVANEVRVVAGDFNVNLLSPAGVITGAYGPLLAPPGNFVLGLTPAPVPVAGFPAAGPGYYATHMKPRTQAQFWPPNAAYPGYGYIGSGLVANLYAIDNMFTRGGAPANFTILNPVVGSPYNAYAAPPGYAPPLGGAITVNRRAGLPAPAAEPPAPAAVPNPAGAANIGQKRSFQGWANYGRVRSTSDHLPIVMDV